MDQLSTKVRPKKRHKTDRPELDGGSNPVSKGRVGGKVDIHNAILKVAPKKGFVLPGHKYTRLGNPLEKQLKYNLKLERFWKSMNNQLGKQML